MNGERPDAFDRGVGRVPHDLVNAEACETPLVDPTPLVVLPCSVPVNLPLLALQVLEDGDLEVGTIDERLSDGNLEILGLPVPTLEQKHTVESHLGSREGPHEDRLVHAALDQHVLPLVVLDDGIRQVLSRRGELPHFAAHDVLRRLRDGHRGVGTASGQTSGLVERGAGRCREDARRGRSGRETSWHKSLRARPLEDCHGGGAAGSSCDDQHGTSAGPATCLRDTRHGHRLAGNARPAKVCGRVA
mmetsp:Transcript_2058/g.5864  ORF Transcript_2058/g.5864 Transcript_2058/m.5864 type:complete len:246 (+) Transcript_2058:228-965(+)